MINKNIFSHASPWILIVLTGVIWIIILTGDWSLRFSWFAWHRTLAVKPSEHISGSASSMATERRGSSKGGNLSHMVAIPAFQKRFEEPRPAFVAVTDEYGYPNKPPTDDTYYPLVVSGDSFMTVPDRMEDRISARLQELSCLSVYNHAIKGRGAFSGVVRFMRRDCFRQYPPDVLVWGIVETDISGQTYVGMVYWLERLASAGGVAGGGMEWTRLSSLHLSRSLPNTSALAQISRQIWNYVRYYVFRQINPDVIEATGLIAGKPTLFYRYDIEAMKWSPEVRNIPQVVWSIKHLDDLCRQRGIELIVLLIPDKEQVYREHIPARFSSPENPIPRSCLWELEKELNAEGISAVNLLGPFREKAKEDILLYWADDTHWNPEGIKLAADLLWAKIEPMIDGKNIRRVEVGSQKSE